MRLFITNVPERIGCGFQMKCLPQAQVLNAWSRASDIIWGVMEISLWWGFDGGSRAFPAWLHTPPHSCLILSASCLQGQQLSPCSHYASSLDFLPKHMGSGNHGLNALKL